MAKTSEIIGAMALGVAVMGWLLAPIISLLVNNFFSALVYNASRKIKDLESSIIPSLKHTLAGVEEQRMLRAEKDERSESDLSTVDQLASEIKCALHEAEDILDLIDYHQIEKKVVERWIYKFIGIKCNQKDITATGSFLLTVAGNNLRKRIEHIENVVNDLKKSHLLNQQSTSEIPIKDTYKVRSTRQEDIEDLYRSIQPKVFGRDEDREKIIRILRYYKDVHEPGADAPSSSTTKRYSVIGIYGIAGSGKSTLARYICDYEKAQGQHFDPVMFIHVSETFRVDKIFRDMLREIRKDRQSDCNDVKDLHDELKEKLRGKRFLLVLDDLRVSGEKEERAILLNVLDAGDCGSRILVTAQKKDAAAALGAQQQIPIPDMEEEQYFSMFMHYALEGTAFCTRRYMEIGRIITEKLHRSPIAAITVAARLQSNNSIDFWETTANLDLLNETMGALWWSYQQLGVDIRRCFAYCSTFPRGYRIGRDELIRIWIAQGFVNTRARSNNTTEELEDIGQFFFHELLMFSFLKVQRTIFGTEAFIHDLLHELADRVAGRDFFRFISTGPPKEIVPEVRHLFIQADNRAEIIVKIQELIHLRTLIIVEKYNKAAMHDPLVNEEVLESLFKRLRKLRVLIIIVEHYHKPAFVIPASIGQMKHLRYLTLNLFSRGIVNLIFPSTFSKLYHIQTIDVPFPSCRVSCPEDMSNLIHLRHIFAWMSFSNIGRLTSLQTMPCFSVKKEQGHELKQLKHLNKLQGTLAIDGLGIVGSKEEALEAHLSHKKRLRKLELSFSARQMIRDPNVAAEALEGLCPPEDLVALTINRYKGSRYPRWMLNQQNPDGPKHLQELCLHSCSRLASFPGEIELFSRLRELQLMFCDWDSLPENMECLVSLQSLLIFRCDRMVLLPTLPQCLEKIGIHGCHVLSTTCQVEEHENWKKIQKIPEKTISPRKAFRKE